MTMKSRIEEKLRESLTPDVLNVINESHMHAGHASESHFKVTVVTNDFEGMKLIDRHRLINKLLVDELSKIHALGLHTYTKQEWLDKGQKAPLSAQCGGGSRA